MAEYFYKPPEPDWRIPKSNINITGASSNRNGEFKVPRLPSRYATQTLCSSAPSNHSENSALECLKPIGDKFEVIDKLKIIPIEEVKQISAEFMQKLDSLCMEKITRQLLPGNLNPAPSVVAPSVINDNGSVFHTIISQVSAPLPPMPKSIPEPPKRVLKVVPSDDENESIVSFLKKNQSGTRTTKKTTVSNLKTTASRNTKNIRSTEYSRSLSAGPSRPEPVRSSQVVSSRTKSVAPYSRSTKPDESISEPKIRRIVNKRSRENDTPVETKKRKTVAKRTSKQDDFNITRDSLRNSSTGAPTKKSKNKTNNGVSKLKNPEGTKENQPINAVIEANEERNIGYEQTDRELFGDVSSIVGGSSFQCSPGNVLKNMTKISSHKNDPLSQHLFSPFSNNARSTSGFSAISTPLSKTLSKNILSKRLKKPDVVAELKGAKKRAAAKRVVKDDIVRLDATEESEFCTSDFSDLEENSDE